MSINAQDVYFEADPWWHPSVFSNTFETETFKTIIIIMPSYCKTFGVSQNQKIYAFEKKSDSSL